MAARRQSGAPALPARRRCAFAPCFGPPHVHSENQGPGARPLAHYDLTQRTTALAYRISLRSPGVSGPIRPMGRNGVALWIRTIWWRKNALFGPKMRDGATARMSDSGYFRIFQGPPRHLRFTPESRHGGRSRPTSAFDPFQTFGKARFIALVSGIVKQTGRYYLSRSCGRPRSEAHRQA